MGLAYDALYARQSIEKKDSISVESQLEYCRYETHGGDYIEYTDRGFSGKDTKRPGFERMMADIAEGKVRRVIVYKLDRISRSILDFANMMEVFRKYDVAFISSTEKFDTSTPIGRAMLNICIVFAQLERETIQKRVSDAYHARCRHGFYMGGRVPYGFRLKKTVIGQVRTSMYEEVEEEGRQVRLVYSMYADLSCSLGDIVRYLDDSRMEHLRGGNWNTARLGEMLRNPVYVRADVAVYRFFKSQGVKIWDPVSDFTGRYGCYLYKGVGAVGRNSLEGRELVLAPHEGLIPPEIWLACRRRCLDSRQPVRTGKAKNSWLAGKVRCGNCGYALAVRRSGTKWGRYFVCSGTDCGGTGCTVYADVLEEYMEGVVKEELAGFSGVYPVDGRAVQRRDDEKEMRLVQIGEEIDALLVRVAEADEVLLRYINERIVGLEAEKYRVQEEMEAEDVAAAEREGRYMDLAGMWDRVSFEDRRAVAEVLLKGICIADGKIEIIWRI